MNLKTAFFSIFQAYFDQLNSLVLCRADKAIYISNLTITTMLFYVVIEKPVCISKFFL